MGESIEDNTQVITTSSSKVAVQVEQKSQALPNHFILLHISQQTQNVDLMLYISVLSFIWFLSKFRYISQVSCVLSQVIFTHMKNSGCKHFARSTFPVHQSRVLAVTTIQIQHTHVRYRSKLRGHRCHNQSHKSFTVIVKACDMFLSFSSVPCTVVMD